MSADFNNESSIDELREKYRQSLNMNRSLLESMSDKRVRAVKYEPEGPGDGEQRTKRAPSFNAFMKTFAQPDKRCDIAGASVKDQACQIFEYYIRHC